MLNLPIDSGGGGQRVTPLKQVGITPCWLQGTESLRVGGGGCHDSGLSQTKVHTSSKHTKTYTMNKTLLDSNIFF